MVQSQEKKKNALHDLGYKIFLDRYALKDMKRETLTVGDLVIVVVNSATGQREVGRIKAMELPTITIELLDGEVVTRDIEHVDKPLETDPAQMMDRVAAGIAAIEKTAKKRREWADNFRWLLEDWKFVPGGRILTAAGTDQELTFYNCYVIPLAGDSRGGIIQTLGNMTEIMSRGGGVGINLSTLRPRHAYVKGVNGRSSGSVSWGALYSFVTGLIEQGGCFGPDERIATDKGLIPAKELADRMDAGETFYAHTHKGLRQITARFRNGIKPLYEVKTNRGYSVNITQDHKVAVLADGKITTTALKYLQEGDEILLQLGDGIEIDYYPLKAVKYERSIMSTTLNEEIQLPESLNEDLAYLIGYMHGDGYIQWGKKVNWSAPKAFKLATADAHPSIRQRLIDVIQAQFGVTPLVRQGDGALAEVYVYSRILIEWMIQNGLLKAKAESIRVPEAIFRSPSTVINAFIAGYFDADGCNRGRKGGYGIDSISYEMLTDVQKLLAMNGIVSGISTTDRSEQGWQTIHRLKVTGGVFKKRFSELIPSEKASDVNGSREMYNTYPATVWTALGARTKYRQRIYDGVSERISYGQMTAIAERVANDGLANTAQEIEELLHTLPDTIASITPIGENDVYDFEVDDVHLICANGIYTSNSRRGALMLILNDWHPDIFDFINSKREAGRITNANISVGLSDRFMDAMKADADWDLQFPDTSHPDYDTHWDGDLEKWIAEGREVLTYKTIKARELWNALIESAWASAEPGVWFRERSNKMSNSWYFNPLIATNPCGEQSLGAFSVCNLGAINLANFYDEENHDVLWDVLERTVKYSVRFLDNVIDTTPYFFEENRKVQMSERRVGLGTMGVAELMLKLHIRYGSDESVEFIDKLYKFMAVHAYQTSSVIAKEKGSFPMFDAEKFVQSGFMQQMPDDVRKQIVTDGIRNVTLLTQAPTGCVAPDTLVSTSTGLQPIVELGDPNGAQWQPLNRAVHTDVGLRDASQFYVNGTQPVKKITTGRGFSITATHNHRIRVIDECGKYVWRRMDELRVGDTTVLKKNTLGDGEYIALTSVEQGNRSMSQLPIHMTPEFAELLGLYMGDGYTKARGGLHIVVAKQDPDLLEHVKMRLQSVWGERTVPVEDRTGCWVANLNGYYIGRFFEANGMKKPAGNHGEGAAGAFIPSKVLAAGRESVKAFLRGLFEADGSINRGTITLVSTSEVLVKQVQVALLGLGIIATLRQMPKQDDRYGDRILHELRLLNRRECEKFAQEVNFISQRKRAKAQELGTISDRGDNIAVPELLQSFYAQSQGLPSVYRQKIAGLVSNGALTQQSVKQFVQDYPVLAQTPLAQLVSMDVYLDTILTIEDGISATYDLSVPDNHTYIANGFVSHNTTGTMVNTSTGIEPFFSWVYYRKSRLGLHEEKVPIVKEWYDEHPDATKLPEYFITAMDLAPMEHVKVQGAFQRWIDSAISKTANLPNNYTIEQTAELYEYMYSLGCKGGTVYRDGSRDEQVLMLKGDERAEKENDAKSKKEEKVEQVATPHRVYPRPKRLHGVTVNCQTPFGTAYVTMNSDEQGYPFEVFITAPGKAGSDLQADAEGLGRMISLSLRTTEPHNRREMLRLIIEQLRDIGGSRSVGFGMERVTSLPDAVARAMEDTYFPKTEALQLQIPMMDIPVTKSVAEKKSTNGNGNGNGHSHDHDEPLLTSDYSGADLCPSCGTISLIRAEGCRRCLTCGYTEC
jgi:ribonucleotide reductase alpha subunit/intein/homing endonuclease